MRSRRSDRRAALVLLGAAGLACSAGAGRTGGVHDVDFRQELGAATEFDLNTQTSRLLARLQYDVARRDGPPEMYVESRWRPREPFVDEMAKGVTAAESRILVRGRLRPEIGTSYARFSVSIVVENRVRMAGSDEWTRLRATPMFLTFARDIADQLERELQTGVRRFERN